MNNKDKEAFVKYMGENLPFSYYVSYHCPELKTWQDACGYKQKEILEWKEAARSEADEVNRIQAENKKLREALNISKDSLKDLRDIYITSYAAKLKIGHTLEALKEAGEK
jgi:hypothetical protein